VQPNSITFVGVLNACANMEVIEKCKHVHEQIIESGRDSNVFVGSSLVDMYAECGNMEDAWTMFTKMPSQNVLTWNALILGHAKCGQRENALKLFQQMQHEDVRLDFGIFVGVLNSCANTKAIEEDKHVHEQIIESGWDLDAFAGNSLVDMYTKCGRMEDV